jgi:predicted ester cyclase
MRDKVGLELLFLAEVAEEKLREYWASVDMAERRAKAMQVEEQRDVLPALQHDVSRVFAQPPQKKRRFRW